MVSRTLVLLALLVTLAPASWAAPGGMWAARLKVEKPLAVSASFDDQGRLWLARVERRHVWVARSDDGGASFGAASQVNAEPEAIAADGENRPKIAVATDGTVHVSWTVSLAKPYTGHVRYSRSRDGGKTFTTPVTVNDDVAEISHRFESLLVRGDRVVLAWLDGRERKAAEAAGGKTPGVSLYYAVSEDAGARFAPNRRAVESTCECCRVALAWQGEQPLVLWRHVYPGNIRDFAMTALGASAPPRRVSDDQWHLAGCPHHGGDLAADGRGRMHLVWYTQGKARQGLFYRTLEGEALSEPVKFGDDDAQAGHPAVLASGDTVVLAWREFDGKAYSVWTRRSGDAGRTWAAPRRVLGSDGPSDYPLLIARQRQLWLIWNTEREGLRAVPLPEEKT